MSLAEGTPSLARGKKTPSASTASLARSKKNLAKSTISLVRGGTTSLATPCPAERAPGTSERARADLPPAEAELAPAPASEPEPPGAQLQSEPLPSTPAQAESAKRASAGRKSGRPPPLPPPGPADQQALIEELLQTVRLPLRDRLQFHEEIGRGGVGAVRVVTDRVLQRRIAMKKMLPSVLSQPLMVRSFIREAQITAQLDHPNLVPVHDIGIDENGQVYFTMKLVEGRTLAQLIEDFRERDQHIDQAYDLLIHMVEVLIKVCDALAFAHSRGVIHCDIKAQNIMVGDYGQVYLMDWGFAQLLPPSPDGRSDRRRVEDPLPKLPKAATSGYVFGTPGYMSPEQAQGLLDQLDERTDVFSLGAVLYHILAGQVPYRADTVAETVLKAQRCDYPPLESDGLGFYSLRPRELVRIATKAMARLPADRYQSVAALQADLNHFVRGGGHFPTREVPAGTLVIREGEEGDTAFIITSGQCEVYKTVDGKKVPLQVLKAGEVVGEMALLTSAPRSASVLALTDVKLMVVTRDVIEQEMNSMKPWMGALVRSLANRFREYQEHSIPQDKRSRALPPEGRRPWWKIW
ncbi:MAG: cyclic nucleotide-binding domain-containing protein [Myxococcota bacterium]|nr:cyclic nucleotide-binding domain-containing protein [Myxococcota bacterium]